MDAKNGRMSASPMPHSRAVRANACTMRLELNPRVDRGERLGLELVEDRALGGRVEARGGGRPVDDLVGDAHERVDVADVRPGPRTEQAGGEAEGGGVRRDHCGRGILSGSVVQGEPGRLMTHGMRSSTRSASSRMSGRASRGNAGSSHGGAHSFERIADQSTQAQSGAALLEGDLGFAHRDRTGVGDGERVVDARPRRGLPGEGDQRRALGFAQVAALVAAGLLGRAERADQVVHELEGQSEPAALGVEGGDRLGGCAARAGRPRRAGR